MAETFLCLLERDSPSGVDLRSRPATGEARISPIRRVFSASEWLTAGLVRRFLGIVMWPCTPFFDGPDSGRQLRSALNR